MLFTDSDVIISNNTDYEDHSNNQEEMRKKVERHLALIYSHDSRPPLSGEALMAMAYASGQLSSCLKRKVGAIIVNTDGLVFSSGYNEVPKGLKPCKGYKGRCYRSFIMDRINRVIDEIETDNEARRDSLKDELGVIVTNLDYCRSLHAEESAILNVAKCGGSLALLGSALYTTTYPCNMCANKIAQLGMGKIVYLEPYPMKEAKRILDGGKVAQECFEGISFRGYFRLFGGRRHDKDLSKVQ